MAGLGDESPDLGFRKPKPPPPSPGFARAGTLSWQQRPTSRGLDHVRGQQQQQQEQPLAADNRETVERPGSCKGTTAEEQDVGGRGRPLSQQYDGSDFLRQTAERAKRSEAFRQSRDLEYGAQAGLPSMGGRLSPEKERTDDLASSGSLRRKPDPSPTRSTARGGEASSAAMSLATKAPPPLTPPERFVPSASGEASPTRSPEQPFRPAAMSPTQARMSQDLEPRATSPTKGMGSFVQSAMMKRADSISRRDSARSKQRPLSLAKGGSNQATNDTREGSPLRSSNPGSPEKSAFSQNDIVLQPTSKESPVEKAGSPARPTSSRPTSSSGELVGKANERPASGGRARPFDHAPLPKSEGGSKPRTSTRESVEAPPASKASTAANQQPSWMEELKKKKAAGASTDTKDTAASLSKETLAASSADRHSSQASQPKPSESSAAIASRPSASRTPRESPAPPEKSALASKSISEPSRPKPEPPSKVDFRANLKSRPVAADKGAQQEAEFKNVFGKLKKAETKNYVAPDELKNNIMRGKAGLAITGGPKPSERRDELKESILKKKEEMKPGGGAGMGKDEGMPNHDGPTTTSAAAPPLQASKAVGKPIGSSDEPGPKTSLDSKREPAKTKQEQTSKPEAPSKPKDIAPPHPSWKTSRIVAASAPSSSKPTQEATQQTANPASARLGLTKTTSNETEKTTAGKMKAEPKAYPRKSPIDPVAAKAASTETQGGLADRFNPALAGLIAKGPPPAATEQDSDKPGPSVASSQELKASSGSAEKSEPLTHATKGRARGPKRRLPTAASASKAAEPPPAAPIQTKAEVQKREDAPSNAQPSSSTSSSTQSKPLSVGEQVARRAAAAQPGSPVETAVAAKPSASRPAASKPDAATKVSVEASMSLARGSNDKMKSEGLVKEAKSTASSPSKPAFQLKPSQSDDPSKPEVLSKKEAKAMTTSAPKPATSPKPSAFMANAATSEANHRSPPMTPKSHNIISKSKAPLSPPEQDATPRPRIVSPKPLISKAEIGGNEVKIAKPLRSPTVPPKDPDKPAKSPKSPPVPAKDSAKLARIASNSSLSLLMTPPIGLGIESKAKEAPEALSREAKLIKDFFQNVSNPPFKTDLNTQSLLSSTGVADGKIKTLQKEIWEITGDGKRTAMPPHQQHLLFENSMYLCTHRFTNQASRRCTEVYLWYGDGVSSSAVEDAQLFCRNAAREAGGKLSVLTQGKESPNFLEALGGILVVRQGSAAHAPSTYVLRGRKHIGHLTFDEVPFAPRSLCSGFPHLVAAPGGRLHLWIGRGASADELGCARLIGMDVGTGEIDEVDDGREPAAFWRVFGGSAEMRSAAAPHWAQKAANEKYRTRLFAVDDARPKSGSSYLWNRFPGGGGTPTDGGAAAGIREIVPYSQADLSRDGIFVLDTFFEIFV